MNRAEQDLRAQAARAESLGDRTLRDALAKEADRHARAEQSRASLPGHAWLTGPWDRTCVRCGLCVRSLSAGGAGLRTVERGSVSGVVLEGSDATVPVCLDGAIGEYATVREVAPWTHT